jgi:hypothetical protein
MGHTVAAALPPPRPLLLRGSLRRPQILLQQLLLIAAVVLSAACLLPTSVSATAPPSAVKVVHTNSSALSFLVSIPADSDADQLHVHQQPERDGNASNAYFPIPSSPGGPGTGQDIRVDVSKLQPASKYLFTFALVSSVNGSESTPLATTPALISTYSLGPAITLFYASDPTPTDKVTDPADEGFSAGDTLTLVFDMDTNTPAVGSKADIDALIKFSVPLGADYTGRWDSPRILVIIIKDIGQSDPKVGLLRAAIQESGNLLSPSGNSDVSTSVSPPLIGSFAARDASTFSYFIPLDSNNVRVEDPQDFAAYGVQAEQDVPRRIPLDLVFPPNNAKTRGYGINAMVAYPNAGADSIGFQLNGTFAYAMSASVREQGVLTNAELSQALTTLHLIPSPGYTGYTCVEVQLIDRGTNILMADVFVTIRFDAPAAPEIPSLTVGGNNGSLLSNPMHTLNTYRTPLIIALCTVVGFFVLLGLGICAYRKYRGGRDARDFEGQSLVVTDDEPRLGADGQATRRFYYDAKV